MSQEAGQNAQQPSPLSALSPVQIFIGGIVAGVLVLCTIGFFILLSFVMKNGGLTALAAGNTNTAQVQANPTPTDPGTNQPSAPIVVAPIDNNNDHIRGNKNAKVTLVEYSDFECPYCGRFAPTVDQAMKAFGDKIRLVYRHFPLSFHPQAEPAAEASECANEQGKFWEFHDVMFQNQDKLSADYFKQVAKDLGLNVSKFNDCVTTHKYQKKVQDQAATGDAAGVQGTPHTIVIGPNGQTVPVSGAQPYSKLEAAIKQFVN